MPISASSIFGSSVSLDESTPSLPKLIIELSDLQDDSNGGDIVGGGGLDDASTITSLNLDVNASKIIAALLLLHFQNQPPTDTDETNGTFVVHDSNRDKRFVVRNNVGQIRYDYRLQIYTPDSISTLDPDNVL